jgi:hypothetical protein
MDSASAEQAAWKYYARGFANANSASTVSPASSQCTGPAPATIPATDIVGFKAQRSRKSWLE